MRFLLKSRDFQKDRHPHTFLASRIFETRAPLYIKRGTTAASEIRPQRASSHNAMESAPSQGAPLAIGSARFAYRSAIARRFDSRDALLYVLNRSSLVARLCIVLRHRLPHRGCATEALCLRLPAVLTPLSRILIWSIALGHLCQRPLQHRRGQSAWRRRGCKRRIIHGIRGLAVAEAADIDFKKRISSCSTILVLNNLYRDVAIF